MQAANQLSERFALARFHRRTAFRVAILLLSLPAAAARAVDAPAADAERQAALQDDVTQGALRITDDKGTVVECPLEHTEVTADISGFIARVTVTQTFRNPVEEKIEAVYVFPLPHQAAVDDMTMIIRDRKIVGLIKRREEARRIYEQALYAGQTAALLEQERPNIFTQSVGNIPPGEEVRIQISYVDVLNYDLGSYEFYFPMVVGPRYNPGQPVSSPAATPPELQGQVSPPVPDTDRVPDASRISPPVLKPDVRNGHDISLSVSLDAGVPVHDLSVANHRAEIQRDGKRRAEIQLAADDTLPNKDFVLRYDVVGDKPEMALLAHTGEHSADARRLGRGYFMLMVQPQEDERLKNSPPREIVFLVDVSGSMSGAPTAKVIEAMQNMLKLCRPIDTVQVVTFAGSANQLFEKPLPVDESSIAKALNFTSGLRGGGGTEMLTGIKLAMDQPIDAERLRIIVMLTDGYIGNEAEIIEHVGRRCGDQIRFWAIGMGSSPNMFLIDGVARQGGGMGKRLGLEDDSSALTQEVMTRIQRAQLANIEIDWGGLQVAETYPAKIPELWAGRPVVIHGRYLAGGNGTVTVKGTIEGQPARWPLVVDLPAERPKHDVLAKIWARQKIENLMQSTFYQGSPAVEEEVTSLALDYRLMSPYTSFVAVDESEVEQLEASPTPPRRMLVPVPLPEGTQWEGFFGDRDEFRAVDRLADSRFMRGRLAAGFAPAPAPSRPSAIPADPALGLTLAAAVPVSPRSRLAPTEGLQWRMAPGGSGGIDASFGRRAAMPANHRGIPLAQHWFGSAMGGMGGGGGFGLNAAREQAERVTSLGEQLSLPLDQPAVDASVRQTLCSEILAQATAARQQRDLPEALAACQRAYLLDTAAVYAGVSNGSAAAQAEQLLQQVRDEMLAVWKKQQPLLSNRLHLVLRDRSVEESLQEIAKSARIEIRVLPGSIQDAATLMDTAPRVDYLDLQHATVADALDWVLIPARLQWHLDHGKVIVGSARRLSRDSTWVYDVTNLVLLSKAETDAQTDQDKRAEMVKAAAEQLRSAVQGFVRADDQHITWYGPGQLLLSGTQEQHETAGRLLSNLADPEYTPPEALTTLHAATYRRAKQNVEAMRQRAEANRLDDTAVKHLESAWPLLAEAADSRLDLHALTNLQIAWGRPETVKLLDTAASDLVFRSLWAIERAAAALPQENELSDLARKARRSANAALEKTLSEFRKPGAEQPASLAAAYASLIVGREESATARRWSELQAADSNARPLAVPVTTLLNPAADADRAALLDQLAAGVGGEDRIALTALACRHAGRETWEDFRRNADELMSRQPLPGELIVLINRLNGSGL